MNQRKWTLLLLLVLRSNAESAERTNSKQTYNHPQTVKKLPTDGAQYDSTSSIFSTSLVSSTPHFTLPYVRNSLICRHIATAFLYRNNLCDASDPNSYTVIPLYRGSVHPLQDVALRITSPVVSLSGISAPTVTVTQKIVLHLFESV